MDSKKQIIQSLRDYFDLCGLTQTEVAEKLGIAKPTISLFLSVTNPHRINNKSATRLCASFPFNFDYLVSGRGSLLTVDAPSSDFPDRTNWSPRDYMVAIRRVEYETKCHEAEIHLSNILAELFVDKNPDSMRRCEESVRNILSLPEIQDTDWRTPMTLPENEKSEEQLDKKLNELLKVRSTFRLSLPKEIFYLQKKLPGYVLDYLKQICE